MRTFLHVDLDAFFCAIEEQRDPSLRGKPFAVGGRPEQRGVVASCSYPARRHGVRSAMPMARAQRLCPQLIVVPSRHTAYRAASTEVMALLHRVTPLVEQLSIDEAFLDVSELISPVADTTVADTTVAGTTVASTLANTTQAAGAQAAYLLARELQQEIQRQLGLSCSIGVASNKMIAKIANDYGKANASKRRTRQGKADKNDPPRAICVVPHGREAMFLSPLPVSALWGVGPKTEAALTNLGLCTIGELAAHPADDLMHRFGQHGYDLSLHAHGIDKRGIVTERAVKSISSETTFARDVQDWDELQETLKSLVEDVVRRLHRRHLLGSTVKLKLRWPDFTTPTRQLTLLAPTDDPKVIGEMANKLFCHLWTASTPIRLLGVGVSGLSPKEQLVLWDILDDENFR